MTPTNSELTHLTKDQAALVDQVKTYHDGLRQSYEHQVQYAFMAGLKLTALKDSCLHGNSKEAQGEGFRALCASQLPELSGSVITRYLDFTRLLIEKMPSVVIIQNPALLLKNGDLPEKEKEAVLQAVHDATEGRTWTAFYRDLRLIREKIPPAHHPIKPRTPDEIIAAENEQAAELIKAAQFAVRVLIINLTSKTGTLSTRVPVALWKDILRTTIQFNKLARPLTKRKLSPAEKKQETKAKLHELARARWDKLKQSHAANTPPPRHSTTP